MFGRGFGPLEILLILGILAVLFGASRLPKMGNSLGRSFREFKKGITGEASSESSDTPGSESKSDAGSPSRH